MEAMPPQAGLDDLKKALVAGFALLDVRETDEFEQVRVPQAVSIPLSQVVDRFAEIADLARSSPLMVICASGGRSNRAAAWLRQQGIKAVNVAGGTNSWDAAGYPTLSGPSAVV